MRPSRPVSPVFTLIISHPPASPRQRANDRAGSPCERTLRGRLTGISEINEHAFAQRLADRLAPDQVEAAREEADALTYIPRT